MTIDQEMRNGRVQNLLHNANELRLIADAAETFGLTNVGAQLRQIANNISSNAKLLY